ncbi:hypothetical protein [Kribbella monticola]|uniref:hypothetical protein n=1 Tax=Kribbella monticola TaxID=2185285 RepID=UPI001300A7B5|nr:hypothetical protein [Kribbella monticola]
MTSLAATTFGAALLAAALAPSTVLSAQAATTASAQAATTAVPGLHRVAAASAVGSPATARVTAECAPGESITGVGGEVSGGRGQAGLSTYTDIEREWGSVSADEDADGTANAWSVTAYAICSGAGHRDSVNAFSASNSAAEKAVTVSCPAGTFTTGAAASTSDGGRLVLDDAIPSADLTKVTVDVFESQAGRADDWSAIASARCGDALPGLERVAATSPTDSATDKSVTATCPAGKKVVGTGHELTNAKGQVLLDDVVPSEDLTSVRAEAFEDQDGTTAAWSLTAYAVCATT